MACSRTEVMALAMMQHVGLTEARILYSGGLRSTTMFFKMPETVAHGFDRVMLNLTCQLSDENGPVAHHKVG
jgi:hypothetical protein